MYTRILVPIDGSEAGRRGLGEAIGLGRQTGAHLVLLHIVEDFPISVELASSTSFDDSRAYLRKVGRNLLDQAASQAAQAGVAHEAVLDERMTARAADVIIEQAGRLRCDLIVMGTHGRRGLKRVVMGSDAELVVRASPVPVLLVRQPT